MESTRQARLEKLLLFPDTEKIEWCYAKKRLRCDDGRNLLEFTESNFLCLSGQSITLVISELESC